VVSPQSPFKKKNQLLNPYDRLHLVELATQDNPHLLPCNIEFGMPVPSYTIDTLVELQKKHPRQHFHLIMGSDNLVSFPKWRKWEVILAHYPILVYARAGSPPPDDWQHPNIHWIEAPNLAISASLIRERIAKYGDARYLVPDAVNAYIQQAGWYR
jgi:nicotinate-nucleotide adenylyltransferase